ncbi:exopolysaccharide biosynthesis polyprenyl glycosylphosphotransferase [Sphingobium sp. DEHP117]|uniref:exopolysaccharide biosynthesis polyprenyl glycosylphosphotransferase n=1 Tax=Sphingobium sp. DEHP117 TaxID=2993436 RepID=UPI0027D56E37|nr:exopolysaccharide biosynthesis polyprenyl glycosylphosphotransferase [Sphingobium sp. DEHP117]
MNRKVRHESAAAPPVSPPVSKEHARLRLYLLGLVLDMWGMLGSFILANWLVLGSPWGEPGKPHGIVIFTLLGPIYALLAINGGAYGLRMLGAAKTSAAHALLAFVQAAMLTLFIIFLAKIGEQISRLTFVVGGGFSVIGLIACRYGMTALSRRILGAVPRMEMFIADGVALPHVPPHMTVVDARKRGLDPTRHDAKMAEKLARIVGGAEHVVVACPSERIEDWSIALKSLSARGEILVPEMARFAPARVGSFQHLPTLIVAGGPLDFRGRIIKRIFDVVVSLGAIIVLSPLLIATAIAVKLTSPGPILFRQARLGRDARPFDILKFRSMRAELSDHTASQLTQKDDPRVTRVGAFIRKTSIDELPQLFNVLKGDMSIVGPRPHAAGAKAADSLYWEVDSRYWARHCIKPGITGLAQIRGHRGTTDAHEDLLLRLQSDLEYVTDWSVSRDIRIMLATVAVLVHHRAY